MSASATAGAVDIARGVTRPTRRSLLRISSRLDRGVGAVGSITSFCGDGVLGRLADSADVSVSEAGTAGSLRGPGGEAGPGLRGPGGEAGPGLRGPGGTGTGLAVDVPEADLLGDPDALPRRAVYGLYVS